MSPRMTALAILVMAAVPIAPPPAASAPATAHLLGIQGVARNAADALIPGGNVAVRIYADSIGGTSVYDSGSEFAGAITQGIFDVLVGRVAPLLLDPEHSYFLELDAAGIEVVGDAAGGRWRFYPGGGSRARPDFETRLDAMETAVGFAPAPRRARSANQAESSAAQHTNAASSLHGLLGLGNPSGSANGFVAAGNLLTQPVGVRANGGVTLELGPYYLFAPKPAPAIRLIRDIGNDQGRAVRVRWRYDLREHAYSPTDTTPSITSYTLYRRVNPGQAPRTRERAEIEAAVALPPGDWDALATVPATLDSSYQTVVPTLCDSTDLGICWSAFVVRSITNRVGIFHESAADSGYSMDNLAPNVPGGLVLQFVSGTITLHWNPSSAPDFRYFRVYRSTNPGFTPGPATLVHATVETTWNDPTIGPFTYKLTAADFNGNESAPAVAAVPAGVTVRVPTALALASLAPNPFRRTLGIVIEVPEAAGAIDLSVFDVRGRRLTTLARGTLPAGRHSLTWDGRTRDGARVAAGVYIARLTGAGRTLTRRATLLP